ncbi:hypothetical protein NP233_g2950 [Leucocoprinus birnbaumii]|uniref:DUF6533 domain-containing protein n=1 Tax=Leucocoprinus birnbaumii TaxID=56174 RepID=A0AAD5VXF0_9AGAR|nr:hypothetical protein NP233_g2950 [Leucocoprinus birnbaumii]
MKDLVPVEAVHVAYAVRICQLIPTVVTLYDHLLTFDQEIELVWKKPRTLAKVLFLWNRYFGTIFLLTNAIMFSVPPTHDHAWGTAIIVWSMQSTVLFCTCAMYPHSSYIRVAALFSFICEVASMAAILIVAFVAFEAKDAGYVFCIPNHIPRFFYAFWIPVIALDCIYFALALRVLVRRREHGALNFTSSPSVLETLARDSLMYFFVTLLTYVANAVVWIVLPARWVGLPQAFSMAGTSIMGVKLAFNLRGVYYCQSVTGMQSDGRTAAAPQSPAFNNNIVGEITVTFRVLDSTSVVGKNINGSPS